MKSSGITRTPGPKTVEAALAHARALLGNRLEADLLAGYAFDCQRSWLYAHGRDPVTPDALDRLDALVRQRLAGRPIAQLCGWREFHGREFHIDEHVLIPRPETELLVDLALALPFANEARICDVGTGSGCIALTLAAERTSWRVVGVDSSAEALAVAAVNRERLGLPEVELLHGDLLGPVADREFDLIVSNPPYVAAGDPHLEQGDLRFEPRHALAGGPDGLEVIRRLIMAAFASLKPGGWLLIEHGHDQAEAVRSLLAGAGFHRVQSRRDLAGIERVGMAAKPPAGDS